jgi:hypothetical protein
MSVSLSLSRAHVHAYIDLFHKYIHWYSYMLVLQLMVEVRVPNLDCEGCASKLKKALLKLKGR